MVSKRTSLGSLFKRAALCAAGVSALWAATSMRAGPEGLVCLYDGIDSVSGAPIGLRIQVKETKQSIDIEGKINLINDPKGHAVACEGIERSSGDRLFAMIDYSRSLIFALR